MLEFNFNWELLSAIAGMTFWNFYFQLFPKTIRSAQVIEFLGHLKRHLRGPLLVIWDRLPAPVRREPAIALCAGPTGAALEKPRAGISRNARCARRTSLLAR